MVETVAAGRQALRQLGRQSFVAFPPGAHVVAELVVPLGPARRKAAHLVAAGSDVPWLGHQLDARQHRVLPAALQEPAAFVEAVRFARKDGRQVEAEAVDAHLGDPIAQAVGHHLQHARMAQVERVAGAGVVDVVARARAFGAVTARHQAVVARVVDALERQRRAEFVALRRVVVDHVHDDFEAVLVKTVDHRLELVDVRAVHVALVEREKPHRVVAPVVGKTLVRQERLVQEHLDRQQLDAGHPQFADVTDGPVLREPGEGAAHVLWHVGPPHGEPTDVGFVEDRLVPWHAHVLRLLPLKVGVDHHAFGHHVCAVAFVEAQVGVFVADGVAEEFRPPLELAHVRLGVRVHQQLVVIEAMAFFGLVRTVHPVAVARAGLQARHEAVPDLIGVFGQGDAGQFFDAGLVVDADLDFGAVRGEQREVDALAGVCGAQRVRRSFFDRIRLCHAVIIADDWV